MTSRLRKCEQSTIAGRMRKAEQFMRAAETIQELAEEYDDVGDALVTLWVHVGVASADVICCIALGEYVQGDDHNMAVTHLGKVRPDGRALGNSLRTLLRMTTRAGYTHERMAGSDLKRAQRAAQRLLEAARIRRAGA